MMFSINIFCIWLIILYSSYVESLITNSYTYNNFNISFISSDNLLNVTSEYIPEGQKYLLGIGYGYSHLFADLYYCNYTKNSVIITKYISTSYYPVDNTNNVYAYSNSCTISFNKNNIQMHSILFAYSSDIQFAHSTNNRIKIIFNSDTGEIRIGNRDYYTSHIKHAIYYSTIWFVVLPFSICIYKIKAIKYQTYIHIFSSIICLISCGVGIFVFSNNYEDYPKEKYLSENPISRAHISFSYVLISVYAMTIIYGFIDKRNNTHIHKFFLMIILSILLYGITYGLELIIPTRDFNNTKYWTIILITMFFVSISYLPKIQE